MTTVVKDIFFAASSNEGITATGQAGNDLLIGSNNNDTLDGAEGNDEIQGGEGDDNIDGGKGDDILYGGEGNDTIEGGEGIDTIYGGDGNDNITVGNDWGTDSETGTNFVDAGAGDDYVYSRNDQKVLLGDGDDQFNGGFRYLDAGAGDDTITVPMPNYMEWDDYQSKIEFLDGGEGYDILYFGGGSGFKNYGTEELENVAVNFEEYRFSSDGGTVTLGNQIASSGETIVILSLIHI